jgi:hypothetical protein
MIKLYQFAPAWDVPNLSPFCVKVETYLKEHLAARPNLTAFCQRVRERYYARPAASGVSGQASSRGST